jgi:hypothetical protein
MDDLLILDSEVFPVVAPAPEGPEVFPRVPPDHREPVAARYDVEFAVLRTMAELQGRPNEVLC